MVLAEGLPSRPPKSTLGSPDCVVPRTQWAPHAHGGPAQSSLRAGALPAPSRRCRDGAAAAKAPSPRAHPAPGQVGKSVLRDQDAWSSQRPPFGDVAPPSALGEASWGLCGLRGPRGEPQLACLSCLSPTPFLLCLSLQISGEQPPAWPRACPSSLSLASAASTVSAR